MSKANVAKKMRKLLEEANALLNEVYQVAGTLEQEEGAETPKPKKEKKAKDGKWKLDSKQRGRVPNWVLKQTGCKDKAALIEKFGDGKVFAEGE